MLQEADEKTLESGVVLFIVPTEIGAMCLLFFIYVIKHRFYLSCLFDYIVHVASKMTVSMYYSAGKSLTRACSNN